MTAPIIQIQVTQDLINKYLDSLQVYEPVYEGPRCLDCGWRKRNGWRTAQTEPSSWDGFMEWIKNQGLEYLL